MKYFCSYQNSNKGFSLIEVLVGIFVLSLIVAAVVTFQKNIFSLSSILSNNLRSQGEARRALKTMSSEIRSASPSSLGSYPIEQAQNTSFVFYTDIDSDQLKERIRYFLDGNTLKKGIIKPSGSPLSYNPANETINLLAHYIVNGATPIFSYYDENYDGSTAPLSQPVDLSKIRLVKVDIVIDRDPLRSPSPMTFIAEVSIRNLKDNL